MRLQRRCHWSARFLVLTGLLVSGAAHPSEQGACVVAAPNHENRTIECPLATGPAARTFAFQANFSGGHDDTMASLSATLNDRPLECTYGSKISLTGEDGDVSLTCRFSVAPDSAKRQLLKVVVKFSHAEYTGFELKRE